MTPARYIILLIVVTLFAILAVAQRARVLELGYRVRRLEHKRTLLGDANRRFLCEVSALSHPARIAEEIGRLHVPLLDPVALSLASADVQSSQMVRRARTRHR